MASKAFTRGLEEYDSTSGDESNGSTESEELECEDEPNTWTVVDRLKINSKLQEITSCRFCGEGARLRLQNFPRIQWAIFVASRSGGPNLVFHWSAAWPSWQPLLWGVVSFQNFRSLKLGLYFCVDFPPSSELIGYVDLTDSYEIWPKCSLVINAQKRVRLFWYSQYFSFYALSIDEDPQKFNSPTSK